MSIDATTNYMSSSAIEAWMETKTEDLYGNLRNAMGTSNDRAAAEEELNAIKADIANVQRSGGDAGAVQARIKAALDQYPEVPEVAQVLQPIADKLDSDESEAIRAQIARNKLPPLTGNLYVPMVGTSTGVPALPAAPAAIVGPPAGPVPFKLTKDDADAWDSQIGNVVDGLGKQDQLGMINIQEFNSQINQTKQIASALMDAADKAANAIIGHIS